ncbi:alanine dehydrogenase [Sulfurovum sp.]|jgi:alanine dehydrogenase|uniref:alanine dehydrogenase n=1 Tax=Sulfurovum sp. TaxID=1969726 RepID=UPI002A371359|nr:alanine dehydrogenase [Sulfurovum sp.]MDD3498975.1 alanine dehydrogenase [Sulfurovum sp.]MDY0402527.1 alanine dehydrogenase [Sulfurovum sp.]
MKIGVPKEVKTREYRVGMIPSGVEQLIASGHLVYIEQGSGEKSGFDDRDYTEAGAIILPSTKEIYAQCEMIIKVKEPQPEEYPFLKAGQILFAYLHLAPVPELTRVLQEKKVIAIAYETLQEKGTLPLLDPMSQIAGEVSPLVAGYFLSAHNHGSGLLISGATGVSPAKVLIIGSGTVAKNAAKVAAGMGAEVVIMGRNRSSMARLEETLPANISTVYSNRYNLEKILPVADIVIGAVYITGAKTPKLITREMLSLCKKGSILVDVSIDQGGCFETSRPTTHEEPVFSVDGILHYCVSNIPGNYPRTSTEALTNATINYAKRIAGLGWREAAMSDDAIYSGVNVAGGFVTNEPVAKTHGIAHHKLKEIIALCPVYEV